MLADLSPAPAAKYANQAANFGAAPSGETGAAGARAGGIAFGGTSRIFFANILSHQRSSHISDLLRGLVCVGPKRLHALACNATTLSGRVARPQSGLSAAAPLIEALDRTIEENADSKSAGGVVGLLRRSSPAMQGRS